jgi:hypothetical protein
VHVAGEVVERRVEAERADVALEVRGADVVGLV